MSQNIETVNTYLDGFRKNDHAQILACLLVQNCVSRHQPATKPPDTACPARYEAKLLVARRISAGIPLQILRLVSPRTILRWWDSAVVRERRVTPDVLAEMSRDGPG